MRIDPSEVLMPVARLSSFSALLIVAYAMSMLSLGGSDLRALLSGIHANECQRCDSSHGAGIHSTMTGFVLSITSFWTGAVKLNAKPLETSNRTIANRARKSNMTCGSSEASCGSLER
jgi:hypothetical protein